LTPAVYNLLLAALAPLAVPLLVLRALAKGQSAGTLLEKFGRIPPSFHQTRPGAVWLHAVSVGEAQSAAPLLIELRKRFPGQKLFLSVSTPTGRAVAEEKLGNLVDGIFSTPYDFAWAVRSTLRALRPGLLIVLETEIWPNLYRETRRSGAGLLLANARMSDRSAPKYARRRNFFAPVLRLCDAVLTQSAQDSDRFQAAGADPQSIEVAGNLKYDFEPASGPPAPEIRRLAEQATRVVLAGSTREDEEQPVAKAFLEAAPPGALLIVAPRHPHRFNEAAQALQSAGLQLVRRSELEALSSHSSSPSSPTHPRQPTAGTVPSKPETPQQQPSACGLSPATTKAAPANPDGTSQPTALLLDTLGELSSLYPLADLVFIGGSLNGWGGHNVLEPALCNKPVVVGPHMQNFREITHNLLTADGLLQVPDADALPAAFRDLLHDPNRANQLAQNGLQAAEAQSGAAARIADRALQAWQEAAPASPISGLRRISLAPAAALWRLGDRIHRGIAVPAALDRPAVCVGNLSAGGSGKTPAVLWLCERLERMGRRPAILTRGYRRQSRDPWIVSPPGAHASPEQLGDEASLLRRRLNDSGSLAAIGIGADRFAAAAAVLQEHPETDLFLLDDGFQHYRLSREFDLVLIDASHPPDADALLPIGRLRQQTSALARAEAVLLTRTHPDCDYQSLARRLHTERPVFRSRMASTDLLSADSGETTDLLALRDAAVYAFAGIGAPDAFFAQLESLGARLVGRRGFRDHHRYSADDWWRIAADARASNASLLLTTEKDLANLDAALPAAQRSGAPPLWALRIDLQVDDEAELLAMIELAITQ